jgi:tetratricopeptide (TPR) repeat protein
MSLLPAASRAAAGLLLLAAAGCGTSSGPPAGGRPSARLSRDDASFSQALARYSEGLLLETDPGRAAAAQQAFERATRLDPDSRRPTDAVVLKRLQRHQSAEALDELEAYCRKHADDARAHRDLARLAEEYDDYTRAARYYEAAYRLQPDDITLAFARVRALFEDRQDREAVRAMAALHRERPSDSTRDLPGFWALHFVRNEREYDRALPCIELAASFATTDVRRAAFLLFRGGVILAAGRTNEAERAFADVFRSDPASVGAAAGLARLRLARDGAEAVSRAARAAASPQDLPAQLTLASLQLAVTNRAGALPALRRAQDLLRDRRLVPSVPFALLLGSTLDELERDDEAAAVFEAALRDHPDAHEVQNYLAYMWAVDNVRLDEAEKLSERSLRLQPEDGAYLDTLGWIRHRQGRVAEALALLLRALERMPDDPTILDHAGDAMAAADRAPEAIAYWSRSYAIAPSQTTVAEKLRGRGVDPARIPRVTPSETEADDEAGSAGDEE